MTSESSLDGNALGGHLAEVFSFEPSAAVATCAGCGARSPMATWVVFVHAPGPVARCANCERVQLRVVHDESGRAWIDLSGIAVVEIDAAP